MMAGFDRKLDPLTGDYVKNAAGTGTEKTTSLAPKLFHQMKTHLNEWVGDSSAGSLVHLITSGALSAGELADARGSLFAALQVLVDAGLAKDPRVEITTERDRIGLQTYITDLQSGEIDTSAYTTHEE